jgi:hypothetical protein
MKRLLAAVAFTLGTLVPFTVVPADAHPVSGTTTYNICQYLDPGSGWVLSYWHTVHYGSAHVTQCTYILYGPGYTLIACRQYVWNIPNPYWLPYEPTRGSPPYCW